MKWQNLNFKHVLWNCSVELFCVRTLRLHWVSEVLALLVEYVVHGVDRCGGGGQAGAGGRRRLQGRRQLCMEINYMLKGTRMIENMFSSYLAPPTIPAGPRRCPTGGRGYISILNLWFCESKFLVPGFLNLWLWPNKVAPLYHLRIYLIQGTKS